MPPGIRTVIVTRYLTLFAEPLTLKHGELEYKLKFNCKPREMEIWEKDAELEISEDDMD